MNENFTREELIEKYLNGELDEAGRIEFEEKLRTDSEFAEIYSFEKNFKNLEGTERELVFRENLSTILDSVRQEDKFGDYEPKIIKPESSHRMTKFFSYKYRIAAAVLVLISLSVILFYLLTNSGSREDRLFARYYESYPVDFISRSDTDSIALESAYVLYQNRDFQSALSVFIRELAEHPENENIRFYAGICYMNQKQFERACGMLSLLANQPGGSMFEQAQWYYALAALKTGIEKEKVIQLFSTIAASGKFKSEKAKRIIAELK
jgi:tetratricopeptide (TPR) repeat protein